MNKVPSLSPQEIESAFHLLSKDGKKIHLEQVHELLSNYFPQTKMFKYLTSGNESMSKEKLYQLFENMNVGTQSWNDMFEVFEPKESAIRDEMLQELVKSLNPYGLLHKGDMELVYELMDKNRDGRITVEDLMCVYTSTSRKSLHPSMKGGIRNRSPSPE